MIHHQCDVLIIGSGLAGLALALKLADHRQVIVLSKESALLTNTAMAQGGIAAVLAPEDSFAAHVEDTMTAGAGLCRKSSVENIVRQAPDRINDLVNWGVHFDLDSESQTIDLTREGGHSFRRIVHHEDQTGREVHKRLLSLVQAHKNIRLFENYLAIDLILSRHLEPHKMSPAQSLGAYAFNLEIQKVESLLAPFTILATGGAGKVYKYTSNWSGATGDGIAIAYRAGARISNLEFMQFHPTCLYHKDERNFLVTEAVRGEGGELIGSDGQPFMKKYHPMGSLAPRDIVARSIDAEMKRTGAPCVYLDIRHRPREFLQTRFPAIYQRCASYGIDMATEPIPVVPAAHYLCGGVLTDEFGLTDIPGLMAVGETSCNGLHGANRLASNSLLECLAMAENGANKILRAPRPPQIDPGQIPEWIYPTETNEDEMVVIHHMWDEIRTLMWNYVGIVRSTKRLSRAQHRLKNILTEVRDYYSHFQMHRDLIELRNIAIIADLTVECALRRKESRGIHYSLDYPFATQESDLQAPPLDTILERGRP